jgi:hypothetical protein
MPVLDAGDTILISEEQEQIDFCRWMRIQHPTLRFFAIPNGGARHITAAMKLKMGGVSAGVPDLFIPALRLFIEMKRVKGGVVSKEQKEWIIYLISCGYNAVICKGFDEAKASVEKYL